MRARLSSLAANSRSCLRADLRRNVTTSVAYATPQPVFPALAPISTVNGTSPTTVQTLTDFYKMIKTEPNASGAKPSSGNGSRNRGPARRGRGGPGRGGSSSSNLGRADGDGAFSAGQKRGLATTATEDASPSKKSSTAFTTTPFSTLQGKLDPRLLSAIPYSHMSEVQEATLATALTGRDILAQAKTGTGKTMAFLIPSIQRLLSLPAAPSRSDVSILVLSPTRELAMQIEKEAAILLANFKDQIGVQHVVGGTNINSERKRLKHHRKDILIATPGRLIDHLKNPTPDYNLRDACQKIKVLVLDEADRMLDMGFRRDLEQILQMLPPQRVAQDRQSLFFSATVPPFVHEVGLMRPGHAFISTLKEAEVNTHQHVPQEYALVPPHQVLPYLLQTLLVEAKRYPDSHKALVFLPTARSTALYASLFSELVRDPAFASLGPVFEIHSRKAQNARTKTMESFRASKTGFLFSSDVTARGVDVPGISIVVQCGLPANAEQYIHRLGRTARAGKDGRGVLLLGDFEQPFLRDKEIKDLPLQQMDLAALSSQAGVPYASCAAAVDRAMLATDARMRLQTYQAYIGYYKAYLRLLGWKPADLIRETGKYAFNTLLWRRNAPPSEAEKSAADAPPADFVLPPLTAKMVGNMGLKEHRRLLNVVTELPAEYAGDVEAKAAAVRGQQLRKERLQMAKEPKPAPPKGRR